MARNEKHDSRVRVRILAALQRAGNGTMTRNQITRLTWRVKFKDRERVVKGLVTDELVTKHEAIAENNKVVEIYRLTDKGVAVEIPKVGQ